MNVSGSINIANALYTCILNEAYNLITVWHIFKKISILTYYVYNNQDLGQDQRQVSSRKRINTIMINDE